MARILTSPVGVMNQARRWSAAKPRHGQCIGHNVSHHARFQRPPNRFPVEQIKHDGQVQPAFIRPQIGDVRSTYLVRCTGPKVAIQHVLHHWQIVFRIRRRLIAVLMPCSHIVIPHQAFYSSFACREAPVSQLLEHTGNAISALELKMDRLNQCQHLRIRQTLAHGRAAPLPRTIAADADCQYPPHFCQTVLRAMLIDPGVLHTASFAKYAAALFMISFSRLSLAFSARNRESSICSSVTGFVLELVSAPWAGTLDQLFNVCSLMQSSLATAEYECPYLTRLTASSLNSQVYDCRGIFIAHLPSSDVNNMSP